MIHLMLLSQIESQTQAAAVKSEESLRQVNDLKDRMDAVKQKFTENEINVDRAAQEAVQAETLANQAEQVKCPLVAGKRCRHIL